jgi:hypothetical protein
MNFEEYVNKLPWAAKKTDEKAFHSYRNEEARIYEQFKQDLFEDLGIEANPKRDKLFSIAWDMGHSAGYQEVYGYACDLVELIED